MIRLLSNCVRIILSRNSIIRGIFLYKLEKSILIANLNYGMLRVDFFFNVLTFSSILCRIIIIFKKIYLSKFYIRYYLSRG